MYIYIANRLHRCTQTILIMMGCLESLYALACGGSREKTSQRMASVLG